MVAQMVAFGAVFITLALRPYSDEGDTWLAAYAQAEVFLLLTLAQMIRVKASTSDAGGYNQVLFGVVMVISCCFLLFATFFSVFGPPLHRWLVGDPPEHGHEREGAASMVPSETHRSRSRGMSSSRSGTASLRMQFKDLRSWEVDRVGTAEEGSGRALGGEAPGLPGKTWATSRVVAEEAGPRSPGGALPGHHPATADQEATIPGGPPLGHDFDRAAAATIHFPSDARAFSEASSPSSPHLWVAPPAAEDTGGIGGSDLELSVASGALAGGASAATTAHHRDAASPGPSNPQPPHIVSQGLEVRRSRSVAHCYVSAALSHLADRPDRPVPDSPPPPRYLSRTA